MSDLDLAFECLDARPDPYAAAPALVFRLRITEGTGARVGAIALRCQLRIEPQRRAYGEAETPLLQDLFGTPDRWGETLKPLQLALVSVMVPGFRDAVEVDVPVPCSYDLDVAAAKYFAALGDGEVPLLLLFSGTVFGGGGAGGAGVRQIPWDRETRHRLPVAVWRELMDRYFPGTGWLRLRRDTLAGLQRFKSARTLATWDEVMSALLDEAASPEAPGQAPGPARQQAGPPVEAGR
ncbi:DUF6084 family protein [Spirillospora sp. NBC_01491]|uniref:DUF6084 family protein n=1 Tax=Spirillospora sp. NBC_01491 TaxID=2976007 RepID=UPI002E2FA185|nr:DUF6084 family protein [Spirillospora sp. NBC_01491]